MHTLTIQDAAPLTLAGIRHTGPYSTIGPTFDRIAAWAGARGLIRPESHTIGLYLSDPRRVPVAELCTAACISVPEPVSDAAAGVETFEIAGGPCAMLRHVGPYEGLGGCYAWLYGTWLPDSGRAPAAQPPYEHYVNDPHRTPPADLVTIIHLPLKPALAGAGA